MVPERHCCALPDPEVQTGCVLVDVVAAVNFPMF